MTSNDNDINVLITGITGQDGSHMIDYLLKITNYNIYGTVRRLSVKNYKNIEHILNHPKFKIVNMDLSDQVSINNTFLKIRPSYCINFAAQSFVAESWNSPLQTFDINTLGIIRLLEALRMYSPKCRFYSAGSSEEFGDIIYSPQDMNHPLRPRSPYGASKCAARHLIKVYRESYDIYAVHGTLFNHEGTRRGDDFVTRKITFGLARIKYELEHSKIITPLDVGNIYSKRDWSDSEEFVKAVWLMINQEKDGDYLLSSGETHTVKEFIDLASKYAEIPNLHWEIDTNNELNTKLYSGDTVILQINKDFYRPAEIDVLHGDSTETKKKLNWNPEISFENLVKKMINHDISTFVVK